jgi:hypothetical protein
VELPEKSLSEEIPEGFGEKVETGIGSTIGSTYLRAQQAAQNLDYGLDNLWAGFYTKGSLFSQIQNAILPFTMIGVVIWLYALFREASESGGILSKEALNRLYWIILVAMLVGNDGYILGSAIRVLNEMVFQVNQMVLNASIDGVSNRDKIREAQLQSQFQTIASELANKCSGLAQAKDVDACQAKINEKALAILKEKNASLLTQIPKAGLTLGKVALEARFMGNTNNTLMAISLAVTNGFLIITRVSLFVWASTAPLWVAITLFPLNTRGINIFLLGFWNIGVVIVTFSMLQGTIAFLLATTIGVTPMTFAIVSGILAPVVAVLLAGGSSFALINAAGGAGSKVVQVASGGISQ